MYIRKKIRNFMEKMPKNMKMPKHWKKFVNEHSKDYNLLIKHGNSYECTNCGKYSYDNMLINPKNKLKGICPFCQKSFYIRNSNLKHYYIKYDLAAVDNVDNKLIIRYFEICRYYNYKRRRFDDSIVEYARIVPEYDIEIVNDRFHRFMTWERIYHTRKIQKWRIFTGMYSLKQYYESIYLENMNEKVKGTIYEYAPLADAVLYLGNHRTDFLKVLEIAKYPSFELLMKAGLYNLAVNNAKQFNEKGSFEKRFGVNKKFYGFMKRHNITYDELQVLQIINRPNMSIIRGLLKLSKSNIRDLLETSLYVNLITLNEYSKKQKNFTVQSYLDYLENIRDLEIPLTKKILYPKNFQKAHNESVKKVKIVKDEILQKKIKQRGTQLEKNQYQNNVFFIRPAKSLDDMKDEAKQQNNCVYKNYSESYANGETDIYFLRNINKPEKSLVTVEVCNGKIRQERQKYNKDTTKAQKNFLEKWENEVLNAA